MRKPLLILFILGLSLYSYAQKMEISVQANTGLFHYTGASAVNDSYILEGSHADETYTNDPYGKHFAFSYGAGFKLSLVGPTGFIFGVQTDYEILRSKVNINNFISSYVAMPYVQTTTTSPDISGHTYLNSYAVNINPYIGYRIKLKNCTFDVLPGVDVGVGLSSRENGVANVNYNGTVTTYRSKRDRGTPPNDARLRLGLALHHNKFTLNGSFAQGLTNHMAGYVGSNNAKVYSQLFRLGLGYQIY
ncbi:hypothetical protein [Mucilaginibacter boryungensis]|uniref:Outer membrane protein with beta-barrel domain n=1 Tax=Mucilaginibacter boryungensis TaxID=768480 RepID=A0ABR9XJ45_9SPHI|nr:hypothetical protein [Mucilaginibacter boryungensis]MBE9667398.1 hypothetical protein [Mucilaginibacter boryungensis]